MLTLFVLMLNYYGSLRTINVTYVESYAHRINGCLLITSVILILSILLQSSKSDGLSGSIAGGTEQLFGRRRAMVMMQYSLRITTVVSAIYIIVAWYIVAIFN